MENEQVTFERQLTKRSETTSGINLPKELIEWIKAADGQELKLIGDKNKHGQRYIAIWNPDYKGE